MTEQRIYQREYLLSQFGAFLTPDEQADESHEGRQRVINRLAPALSQQLKLGRKDHWAYDFSAHLNLVEILKNERTAVADLESEAACPLLI